MGKGKFLEKLKKGNSERGLSVQAVFKAELRVAMAAPYGLLRSQVAATVRRAIEQIRNCHMAVSRLFR